MIRYSPDRAPEPLSWLESSESDRIEAVTAFHKKTGFKAPGFQAHVAIHVTVENQLAMKEEPVEAALKRLLLEGLSRHDAIHAIGWVLIGHLKTMLDDPAAFKGQENEVYYEALREFTAEKWRTEAS